MDLLVERGQLATADNQLEARHEADETVTRSSLNSCCVTTVLLNHKPIELFVS